MMKFCSGKPSGENPQGLLPWYLGQRTLWDLPGWAEDPR